MRIKTVKYMVLALILVIVLSIPGAFATWHYAKPVEPVSVNLQIRMGSFIYPSNQVLPNTPPENHQALVDSTLKYAFAGLNASPWFNGFIPRNLKKYGGVIYSRQTIKLVGFPVQHLMEVFWEPGVSDGVYFIYHELGPDDIAIYTASKAEIDAASVGTRAVIYKTFLHKNADGTWVENGSVKGWTTLKMVTVDNVDTFLAFDPRQGEWHAGEIPINL